MVPYQLTEQQITDANAFMASRFTGNGVYTSTDQFTFAKDGDDIIITDTNTDQTANLGPEVVP